MTPLLGKRHSFNVLALAWSPDGGRIAAAGHGHVQVWDATTGRNSVTYRGHSYYVYAVAWSPCGQLIASAGYDGQVHVWEAASGHQVLTYFGHAGRMVQAIGWCADGRHLVSYGHDRAVHTWDTATGQTSSAAHLKASSRLVRFSPDGTQLAVPSRGVRGQANWVTVVETTTALEMVTYTGQTAAVVSLAWSLDGRTIASADKRGELQGWVASTGALLFAYHGPSTAPTSLAWSPDGANLALGGRSGNVQLLDASAGTPLLTAHPSARHRKVVSHWIIWPVDRNSLCSGQVASLSDWGRIAVSRGECARESSPKPQPASGVCPGVGGTPPDTFLPRQEPGRQADHPDSPPLRL